MACKGAPGVKVRQGRAGQFNEYVEFEPDSGGMKAPRFIAQRSGGQGWYVYRTWPTRGNKVTGTETLGYAPSKRKAVSMARREAISAHKARLTR